MFSFRIFRNILKISLLKSGKKSIKFIFIRFIHFKKLEIIISLTDEANIKEVLEDFKVYSTYPLPSINRMLVQAIYYISKKDINLANICIEKLIDFLKIKDDNLVSHVIIILRKLILEVNLYLITDKGKH